jgi:hypothetical protein
MRVVIWLDRFLNARRLRYAWIIGFFLWAGWLVSIFLGSGNKDLNGQIIGPDYVQFYTAGHIMLQGSSAQLYDMGFQQLSQQELVGGEWNDFVPFAGPPFFASLAVPFAKLSYPLSFALWTLIGFLGLWASLGLLDIENRQRSFVWALTWYPVFAAISFGQNSLLSLFLFCLIYRLIRKRRLGVAGLVSSFLLFKPQWVIVLVLFWILEWRAYKSALLGLVLGTAILSLLSFWRLPDASWAYVDFAQKVLPGWQSQPGFPLYHLHTVSGFWLLLLRHHPGWADVLSLASMALGIFCFVLFWRQYRDQLTLLFSGVICFTLWINPHVMIYDWTVLLIPALLLWQHVPNLRHGWKVLYASIWLVTFLSSLLTFVQLQWLPFAVQISVPVYLMAIFVAYRWLRDPPQFDLSAPRPTESGSTVRV